MAGTMQTQNGRQLFVHLGAFPKFVHHYVTAAADVNPSYETILITDQHLPISDSYKTLLLDEIVSHEDRSKLHDLLTLSGFDHHFRNGYWEKIFTRFLALRAYAKKFPAEIPHIHLESDVYSWLTADLIADIFNNKDETSPDSYIPVIDQNNACPSVILSKNSYALANVCDFVIQNINGPYGQTDMNILSGAINAGILSPLPTTVESSNITIGIGADSQTENQAFVVFDGAAIGQYLFGIDPRNNKGLISPGYREIRGGFDPGLWTEWKVSECADRVKRISFVSEGLTGVCAVVHIHSKITVGTEKFPLEQFLDSANGKLQTQQSFNVIAFSLYYLERLRWKIRGILKKFYSFLLLK